MYIPTKCVYLKYVKLESLLRTGVKHETNADN